MPLKEHMRALLLDLMNIISILINGLWCMYCYYFKSYVRSTHIYDPDHHLKLDYYPSRLSMDQKGTIIYAHGGGWIIGTRKNVPPALLYQIERGYAIISISYRKLPRSHFPDPVEDVKSAITWIDNHAADLKMSSIPLIGWGLSAGAQVINYAALQSPHLFGGVI